MTHKLTDEQKELVRELLEIATSPSANLGSNPFEVGFFPYERYREIEKELGFKQ